MLRPITEEESQPLFELAFTLHCKKNFRACLEILNDLIAFDPLCSHYYYFRGNTHHCLSDDDAAKKDLTFALIFKPDCKDSGLLLDQILAKEAAVAEAERQRLEAIAVAEAAAAEKTRIAAEAAAEQKRIAAEAAAEAERQKIVLEAESYIHLASTKNTGETALHLAAAKGSAGAIRYLVSHGWHFHSKCNKGWSPVETATMNKNNVGACLLRLLEADAYCASVAPLRAELESELAHHPVFKEIKAQLDKSSYRVEPVHKEMIERSRLANPRITEWIALRFLCERAAPQDALHIVLACLPFPFLEVAVCAVKTGWNLESRYRNIPTESTALSAAISMNNVAMIAILKKAGEADQARDGKDGGTAFSCRFFDGRMVGVAQSSDCHAKLGV